LGVFQSLAQYPHWFVVGCAAVAAVVLLWLALKLVKAVVWILLFAVLIVGGAAAVWMFLR
jgi:hypothetical protein